MTFSISGHCPRTNMFGTAVTSSSICVAARCGVWARAGAGVIATQNITDPRLGAIGVDLLARGYSAQGAIDQRATLLWGKPIDHFFGEHRLVDARCHRCTSGIKIGPNTTLTQNRDAGQRQDRSPSARCSAAQKESHTRALPWAQVRVGARSRIAGQTCYLHSLSRYLRDLF